MSSEDSKPVKKSALDMDAEDGMSLGSILQNRKKKPSNLGSNSLSKVKKDEVQGDVSAKTPKTNSGSASKTTKNKKEERFNYSDDDYEENPVKKSSAAKRDTALKIKKKVKEEKSKTSKAKLESKKIVRKEKKVYDLPGQKRDPPEERDPLRIFYETLYKQLPHSEMAQFWMMESGLLSKEEAKKVYEKKQKRAALQKISSPVKAVSSVKSVTKTVTKTVTVKKKSPVSAVSSTKKKTVESKAATKQSKKRKAGDVSSSDESEESDESDDDFIISRSMKKKPRTA